MFNMKVHGCNKLASRHIRLKLAEPSAHRRCDICENAPAFFFCGIDGTSLCLQCDMDVHVGGKRTHERYLLMGQRVELPVMQPEGGLGKLPMSDVKATQRIDGNAPPHMNHDNPNHNQPQGQKEPSNTSAIAIAIGDTASQMIDLNFRPHHELSSSVRDMELTNTGGEEASAVVPDIVRRGAATDS
ncbi:hypothetical protein KP509_39G035500 [Ceratopteris richardii]|uniref:B box-type domain-containing protein n=1 Tax=Ceratopteris richardii TaxID=49495 RepID=A0A8T2PZP8_CERRI|nr:hypothetical protein KP509_39G035500 [Ceratopteris richardii]